MELGIAASLLGERVKLPSAVLDDLGSNAIRQPSVPNFDDALQAPCAPSRQSSIGGCGFWAGLGYICTGGKS